MAPTPVSPPSTCRVEPPGRTPPEDVGVLPLPCTEPRPGVRDGDAVTAPDPRPEPAADHRVPVPARRAAHALVLMALEVVDRQRAPHHTRGAFPPPLVEMLRTLARVGVPGQQLGPARVHRIHIHAADAAAGTPDAPESGRAAAEYEVCATYARGPRLFAVAARIRVTEKSATCTALRLV